MKTVALVVTAVCLSKDISVAPKAVIKLLNIKMFSLVVGDEMEIFLFCNSHKYFFTNVGVIKSKYYISLFFDNPWHR